jgi:hypothetical protein
MGTLGFPIQTGGDRGTPYDRELKQTRIQQNHACLITSQKIENFFCLTFDRSFTQSLGIQTPAIVCKWKN